MRSTNEVITLEDFKKRLVELWSSGLSGLPRKHKDRHILLKSVILSMDKTREYSELQINQELRYWLKNVCPRLVLDHVELRRHLIDYEYLGRGRDGSRYWVAITSRRQMLFDDNVEGIDVSLLLRQVQEESRKRKRQRLPAKEI